jgi:hypothetical protein
LGALLSRHATSERHSAAAELNQWLIECAVMLEKRENLK